MISKTRLKDDILFIESFQVSRVSIHVTGIKVAYCYHNNEWILSIIGRISSCGLVLYGFVGPMNRNIHVFFHCPK